MIRTWKATEFRSFLLYTGILVLRGILKEGLYENFLFLHVATWIMKSPLTSSVLLDEARTFLTCFVHQACQLYGQRIASYNVHSVQHLPNDASIHGTLESFSAFQFESFLASIKGLIRTPNLPLEQVVLRLQEQEHYRPISELPKKQQDLEPLYVRTLRGVEKLLYYKFELVIGSQKDDACELMNGTYMEVDAIEFTELGKPLLRGRERNSILFILNP